MSELVGPMEVADMLCCGCERAKEWMYNHGFDAVTDGKRWFFWRAHVEQVRAERIAWGLLDPVLFAPRATSVGLLGRLELPALPPTPAQIEASRKGHVPLDWGKVQRQQAIDEANRKRPNERVDHHTLSTLAYKAGGVKRTKAYRDAIADEARFTMERRAKDVSSG